MPEETTLPQDQVTTPSTETTQQASTPVTQTTEPASTTTTQPVTQTPPATQTTTPAAPTVDVEKVSKSIIDKIAQGLGITKSEEKEQIPTDPAELKKFIEAHGAAAAQKVLDDREQAQKTAQEQQQKQVQEGAARFQTLWKSQYTELGEKGLVPKVVNAEDKNDPGNIARVKLLTKLSEVIKHNQANGIDYVPTLKEVYYENPNILTEEVAGGDVPISGGGRTMGAGAQMPYDKLHNSSFEELLKVE